jgi:hypothetical protein
VLLGIAGTQASAQSEETFSENAVSHFSSGDWQAETASFEGYTFSPQVGCRMSTIGAALTQLRPRESSQLEAGFDLLPEKQQAGSNFRINWVQVDKVRYEAVRLPWRLNGPPEPDSIVLSVESPLFAVRQDPSQQWLPIIYLTLPLLTAKRFEVGFTYENDEGELVKGSQFISLKGFREVGKWCGRELLRDRQNEERVKELTN